MKSNRIAWLGLASVAAGAIVAAACTEGTNVDDNNKPGVCGNGIPEAAEECDDGNTSDNDACTAACRNNVCGDGLINTGVEECDEGGETEDCDADCNGTGSSSNPTTCGNGQLDDGEECDEWDEGEQKKNTPTCNTNCKTPGCDDGILNIAAGECCEDSNEFPCDDFPELIEKKNNGDEDWCLCGNGGGGPGGAPPGCDPEVDPSVAGYVVNSTTPSSPTPSPASGIPSQWSYGGQLGTQAGNDMCAAIGADHVCEWDEVVQGIEKGELDTLFTGAGLTSIAFWIHRLNSTVTIASTAEMTEPGPGGRCNDWTYTTGHIDDGELGLWKSTAPTGLDSSWTQIMDGANPTNVWAAYDRDTCYTGNQSTCAGGSGQNDGVACGGMNVSTETNANATVTAILCCFPICEE